jgi:ATP-binding cassette subfamily B protein
VPAPVGTARYGEDDVVHEAARRPRVDEFVDGLLDGWHTELGPGGARLSGGQRQRASIARALLKDAPIESATRARLWRAHEGTGDGRSATGETTKERVR